jgi:hypothetical protein
MATRYIDGGRDTVLSYIHLAAMNGNDSAMTWWHVFEKLNKYEQSVVSYDDVCAASGISPKNILMAIAGAGYEANCDIANLLASHLHPKIVQASARVAQTDAGIEDRKLMMQHQGFIPVPKGMSININASSHAQAAASAHAMSSNDSSVPSFLEDVDDIGSTDRIVQGELVEAQVKALPPASHPSEADWAATLDSIHTSTPTPVAKIKVG